MPPSPPTSDGALEIGDGYRAKNEELGGAGLMFLRAGHVKDTHIDFEGVERFHSQLELRVRSKLAKPGDAVITTKGNSTGRTTFVSASMPPFVYSPHLSYWRSLDPKRIEGGFLRYWCKGSEFITQLTGMKASTDMAPYLSLVDQKRLEITLPPIAEQRTIAHILGTLDNKIELNRRMNETLEAMARALFKSWFVDFLPVRANMEVRNRKARTQTGDPVHAKTEGRDTSLPKSLADLFPDSLEDSELGDIPQEWEVRGLDEIARFLNGLALQKFPPKDERSLPVIKIAQLRAGDTAGADAANADLDPDYVVEDSDVLFSWSGSLECVLWTGGRGALNQHLFKVTSSEFPKWFYYLWIHQHLADFRRIAAGKATTMGHIQRHHLSEAKVVVPNGKTLKAANDALSPLVDKVIATRIESRSLAALRDTLLPKLISGELQVKDAKSFLDQQS